MLAKSSSNVTMTSLKIVIAIVIMIRVVVKLGLRVIVVVDFNEVATTSMMVMIAIGPKMMVIMNPMVVNSVAKN